MKKGDYFGSHRVIFPEGMLPQAAEKINNDPAIFDNEIGIDVIALQPTATAFRRIKDACDGDTKRISQAVLDIVEERGKFQDPVTKSGGMLIGKIREIGPDLSGKVDAAPGDNIATLVSLSLTPLKIYEIERVDTENEQIYCKADAILFESGIFTKIPEDLGQELSLAIMDVAGAPAQVAINAKPGDVITVVGAGKAGILCLAEAKKRVAPTGTVVCMEYSEDRCRLVEELGIADIVICANGQIPLSSFQAYMKATGGKLSDFSINTVNVPNTELSTILITKDTGKIYFFSMCTDFVKASLGAEGVKKYVPMFIGNGYYPGHADITFQLIREHAKVRNYFIQRYCCGQGNA